MTDSKLIVKLVEAQTDMGNPILDSTASAGSYTYKYASLASIMRSVKAGLSKHGLGVTQGIRVEDGRMRLSTKVFGGDSWILVDERFIPENANAQGFGSFETYMRRYALCSAFGLTGVEDDDGLMTKEESEQARTRAVEAGRILSEAIAQYCAATNQDHEAIRAQVKHKLAMTGEGSNPDALIREAEHLRSAAGIVGGN